VPNSELPLPRIKAINMGYVYLYTGTGGGKTANALGLALRAVGHNQKVVIIQFLKWRKDIGEYLIKDKLGGLYEIFQFGRDVWIGKENATAEFGGEKFKVECVTDRDKELAEAGLAFAAKIVQEKTPDLLVLDEINLAAHWNLLNVKKIIEFLCLAPVKTTIVMTGRYAPQALIDRADFVNTVESVKMPKKFEATKGIQY
jgi:cob(I)alamin adenosyltransferase